MLDSFDQVILDRIHLKLWYNNLDPAIRKIIYLHFFDATNTNIDKKKLSKFTKICLNDWQVRIDRDLEKQELTEEQL